MSDVETGDVGDAGDTSADRGFTETTYESYGSKMKKACTGVCIGFLLFFASIGLLAYNEGRTVKRAKDIDEGQHAYVTLDLAEFPSGNLTSFFENKLIHAVGNLRTFDSLTDPIFGVTTTKTATANTTNTAVEASALKIRRSVEMYQWKETSHTRTTKTASGGTRKTKSYSHDKVWSSSLINSNSFSERKEGITNPTSFPFDPITLEADPILLGNLLELSDKVVDRINWYEPLDTLSLDNVPDETLKSQLTTYTDSGFYYGNGTSSAPVVGGTRITFQVVPSDTISIIAKVNGNGDNLESYQTRRGGSLLLVKRGTFSADELFAQADSENTQLAWILRFVGFILMVASILLVLQPLATAVDIIPFVGDCMQGGMENCLFPTIALIIAIPTSLFVIALAWLAYRPAIAVPIVVVCLGLIVWMYMRARKRKQDDKLDDSDDDNVGKLNGTAYSSTYNNDSTNSSSAAPVEGDFSAALDKPPPSSYPSAPAYPSPTAPYSTQKPTV